MRFVASLVSLCILASTSAAAKHGETLKASESIEVCLEREDIRPDLEYSKQLAGEIFAGIGIEVDWRCGAHEPEEPIIVDAGSGNDDGAYPNALGYAQPSTGHIRVYYSRLHTLGDARRSHLLAYILAHEIAHVLQGMSRHSNSGIMKAHWDQKDLQDIDWNGMVFTEYDVFLIRRGLSSPAWRAACRSDTCP